MRRAGQAPAHYAPDMRNPISIVDLSNGLVSECRSDVSTIDIPATLDTGATELSLDAKGLLHFAAAGGGPSVEHANESPVSARDSGEPFFVRAGADARDEHGWQRCRLHVREP